MISFTAGAMIAVVVAGCGTQTTAGCAAPDISQLLPLTKTAKSLLPDTSQLSTLLRLPMQSTPGMGPFVISGRSWINLEHTSQPQVSDCEIVASIDKRLIDIPAESVAIQRWEKDQTADPIDKSNTAEYIVNMYVVEFENDADAAEWFDKSISQWKRCDGRNVTRPSLSGQSEYSDDITDVQHPSADEISAVLMSTARGTAPPPPSEWSKPSQVGRALTHVSKFVIDATVKNNMLTPPSPPASAKQALEVAQLAKAKATK